MSENNNNPLKTLKNFNNGLNNRIRKGFEKINEAKNAVGDKITKMNSNMRNLLISKGIIDKDILVALCLVTITAGGISGLLKDEQISELETDNARSNESINRLIKTVNDQKDEIDRDDNHINRQNKELDAYKYIPKPSVSEVRPGVKRVEVDLGNAGKFTQDITITQEFVTRLETAQVPTAPEAVVNTDSRSSDSSVPASSPTRVVEAPNPPTYSGWKVKPDIAEKK